MYRTLLHKSNDAGTFLVSCGKAEGGRSADAVLRQVGLHRFRAQVGWRNLFFGLPPGLW
jgi:hypothetical protein